MKNKNILLILMLCVAMVCNAQTDGPETSGKKKKKEKPEQALKRLQQQYDQLLQEHEQLQRSYDVMCSQDSAEQASRLANEERLQRIEDYHAQCRNNLYREYYDYLSLPYSVLSKEKAEAIHAFATQFAQVDEEASRLQQQAVASINHKQLYDQQMLLLSRPYNEADVKQAREDLREIRTLARDQQWEKLQMSQPQWHEIDTIDICLSRYKYGVSLLQSIINSCNDQYKADQLKARSLTDVEISLNIRKRIIASKDTHPLESAPQLPVSAAGNIAVYIRIIPWLKAQYSIFLDEQNPLQPSAKTCRMMDEVMKIETGL